MNHKPPVSPREYLDQRKQQLTQKHQRRLQRMTVEAIQSREHSWHIPWKLVMASAFSIMLIATTAFLKKPETEQPSQPDMSLPAWVMDTEVPLTLIENLEFYDWLAQQPDNQQAKYQKALTVAVNDFYQHRFSQRLTTRYPAQRLSRTTARSGALQR